MIEKVLLKSVMPMVKKNLENGLIDKQLCLFKKSFSEYLNLPSDSIVIVNTTEKLDDGTEKEYINICIMSEEKTLSLLKQFSLSDILEIVLNNMKDGIWSK
jgi:hypothetical protein